MHGLFVDQLPELVSNVASVGDVVYGEETDTSREEEDGAADSSAHVTSESG